MKQKNIIMNILLILFIIIIIFLSIGYELYAWETFKQETGSDIGLLKWIFLYR